MRHRLDTLVRALQKQAKAAEKLQKGEATQGDTTEYRRYVKGAVDISGSVEIKLLQDFVKEYKRNEESTDSRENKRYIWEKVAIGVAGLLAALTFEQARYTRQAVLKQGEQLEAQRRQDEAQRNEFILDRRPYIKVSVPCVKLYVLSTEKNMCPSIEAGKPIAAVIEWKNIGKSPALQFRLTRWVDFGNSWERNYRTIVPFPDNVYPIIALPEETENSLAISRSVFSNYQGLSVNDSDTKAWDGTYPIAIFGKVYFKDTAGRVYCDPYLFLLIKSGALVLASEDIDPKCKDPDIQ